MNQVHGLVKPIIGGGRMGAVPSHFEALLDLEGKPCCRCDSVDLSSNLLLAVVHNNPASLMQKELREFAPITISFNAGIGSEVVRWIADTLRNNYARRWGKIILVSGTKTQSSVDFHEALITQIALPKMDAGLKRGGQLTVQIQAERALMSRASIELREISKYGPRSLPAWNSGRFDLSIDGVDCRDVVSVGPMFVRQGNKALYVGEARFPEYEPTKLEYPMLVVSLPEASAGPFKNWFHQNMASPAHKNGALRYLSSSSAPPLKLNLSGLLPVSMISPMPKISRFEIAVGRLTVI